MAEARWPRPPLRVLVGVALLALGFAEVQSIVLSLRAHARLRERAAQQADRALKAGRGQLQALVAPGNAGAFAVAASHAAQSLGASEFEVFRGRDQVFASPGPSPIRHWPSPTEEQRLRMGEVITVGPLHGNGARVLAYVVAGNSPEALLLRLSTEVPDVLDDLRERDRLFLAQATALVVLLIAAAVAFLPPRPGGEPAPAGALGAYEQAMDRLRDREEEMSRAHQEERRTLSRRVAEQETLARAGELTAGIAHEVRNGLGTIVGYARLIERHAAGTPHEESARSIRAECESLEVVVRRFVDYVRNDRLVLVRFDLGRLVGRVVAREQREEDAHVVLAEPASEVIVRGDEDMLERAIENLVRNARQAVGPRGNVDVRLEEGSHAVRVRVRDDGPGLPAELLDGIRPFVTTKPGGLGLGLATVQKIVRLHGGELTIAPALPSGTEAIISLPRPSDDPAPT